MLVTAIGDVMCWWQDINDWFEMMMTDLLDQKSHQDNNSEHNLVINTIVTKNPSLYMEIDTFLMDYL